MEGNLVEGSLKPSLDSVGLLYIYKHVLDINAIIHTHQVYATALGLTQQKLPPILTTLANAVGGEVAVAPFAPAGKIETGIVTVENLNNKRAVILKNHGVMTVGERLKDALFAAVYLEEAAKSYFLSGIFGRPSALNKAQVEEAVNIFVGYAQ
jgi:L-ribulose-5-phosphate 4-epimerase